MLAMWAAVTRQIANGDVVGGSERIDASSALAGYTINGASAIQREDRVGSIEAGKLADFVILERDPLETPIEAWPSVDTVETIVGGVSAWTREAEAQR
ncbi:MAG: amidohydrolase family protein [Acidimicrobiia bacterium]